MYSGAPWALWRNRFCLAVCLAGRHVQGRKQGTTARHATRVIVGHRLLFDNVRQNPAVVYPWTPLFVAAILGPLSGRSGGRQNRPNSSNDPTETFGATESVVCN